MGAGRTQAARLWIIALCPASVCWLQGGTQAGLPMAGWSPVLSGCSQLGCHWWRAVVLPAFLGLWLEPCPSHVASLPRGVWARTATLKVRDGLPSWSGSTAGRKLYPLPEVCAEGLHQGF